MAHPTCEVGETSLVLLVGSVGFIHSKTKLTTIATKDSWLVRPPAFPLELRLVVGIVVPRAASTGSLASTRRQAASTELSILSESGCDLRRPGFRALEE